MSVVRIDDKNRVRIPKKYSKIIGIKPGDKVLMFTTKFGIFITPLGDKKFIGCLDGINFKEYEHEASKYLFGRENK